MNLELLSTKADVAEQFLKQVANKNRLMILCTLIEGELSVSELNNCIPLAQSALSQHLASLRQAGIVATRREGVTIYYKVVDPKVHQLIKQLHAWFCES